MRLIDKLERKFGKYAISNLPAIIIALYVAGYIIYFIDWTMLNYLTLIPALVLRGQVWRVITWILVPPEIPPGILTILVLYVYFSFGKTLEREWGAFRFNLYIISGIFFTVIGAFLLYFTTGVTGYFSTYYINMSIFLALAATYPDAQLLLYFLIPIKMKWMGVLYGLLIVVAMMQGTWADRVAIIMSLLNFIIFFLMSRNVQRYRPREVHRRNEFRREVKKAQPKSVTRHKCAVCGRTEQDGEDLEFRFCSRCDGNYEYCQDHLFTHSHIKAPDK